MAPDDIINENDGEQEEEQEQEPNIIDLNNYGMKPYSWRYEGSGGGGGSFAPDITDPQDGDTLVYNAAQQKWVNGAGAGGGGGILKITADPDTGVLDKTWKEIRDAFCNGYYVSILGQQASDSYYQTQIINVTVEDGNKYGVGAGILQMQTWWYADSENGYPVPED